MLDVLFKGKRKDNGEWIEGYLVKWINPLTLIPKFFILTQEEQKSGITGEPTGHLKTEMSRYEVDPLSVGQFTGLTDKNNKKIFKSDIVSCKTTAYFFRKCKVVYRNSLARYCILDANGLTFPMEKSFEYEIIGNIFDNPELFERSYDNG